MQDTARVTNHLALSLGVRYDLQTFSLKHLLSNPLWPDSGKVPRLTNNLADSRDRKSTRLNSSHQIISYAVFCLKKKKKKTPSYHLQAETRCAPGLYKCAYHRLAQSFPLAPTSAHCNRTAPPHSRVVNTCVARRA